MHYMIPNILLGEMTGFKYNFTSCFNCKTFQDHILVIFSSRGHTRRSKEEKRTQNYVFLEAEVDLCI